MSRAFTEALLICMKVDSLASISTSFRKSAKRILPVELCRRPTPAADGSTYHAAVIFGMATLRFPGLWRDCSREVHPLTSLRNPYIGWAILHPWRCIESNPNPQNWHHGAAAIAGKFRERDTDRMGPTASG